MTPVQHTQEVNTALVAGKGWYLMRACVPNNVQVLGFHSTEFVRPVRLIATTVLVRHRLNVCRVKSLSSMILASALLNVQMDTSRMDIVLVSTNVLKAVRNVPLLDSVILVPKTMKGSERVLTQILCRQLCSATWLSLQYWGTLDYQCLVLPCVKVWSHISDLQ